jgi:hypothetical protein
MNKSQLFYKLIPDIYLNSSGKIKEEFKYKINIPELKIQNSKFVGELGDKFETLLFLPPNPGRKWEGGIRTKGLFKVNYKLWIMDDKLNTNNSTFNIQNSKLKEIWYICNLDGNPIVPAPDDIQNKINNYMSQFQRGTPQFNIQHSTFNITFKLPLITVITVVYNGAKYLEDTIKSVINQRYPNIEYIIIDGGSTDGTLDVIKKYEDYIDYWVSEPDEGIYEAMNKGIILSNGEWLNFMNCGDSFSSVDILSNIFTSVNLENIDLIYSDIKIKDNFVYICDIKKNKIIHQSLIYKKTLHNKFGFYLNNKKVMVSDYIFFMLSKNKKWFKYDKPISNYNIEGVSNRNIIMHVKQKIGADLIFGNIGVLKSCIMLLFYPLYRLLKRMILKK